MKNIIVIPSYKPSELLLTLLKNIPKTFDIVLIDDGSGKEYQGIFKKAKEYAHVISYEENKGKGHALKTGYKYIKNNYEDYIIVTMDSDGQHRVEDAIKLCDYIKDNPDNFVLGMRHWDNKTPIRSRIGNTITRHVFSHVTKLKIYDTQTGLRAFSNKLIDYMLNIEGERFEYEMNVLLNIKNNHIKYHEIPIATIYFTDNHASHFKAIKDSLKIYKNIFSWKKQNKLEK